MDTFHGKPNDIAGSAQLAKDAIQTEWVEQEILHVQMAVGLVTDQVIKKITLKSPLQLEAFSY